MLSGTECSGRVYIFKGVSPRQEDYGVGFSQASLRLGTLSDYDDDFILRCDTGRRPAHAGQLYTSMLHGKPF